MWGSQQGWNQWALQPAMFNDVPHEQIDWAALAKQWIQMQQTQPPPSDATAGPVLSAVPPPTQTVAQPIIHPAPPPPPPPPPPGHGPIPPEEFGPEPPVSTPLLKTPVAPGSIPEPFQPERPYDTEPAPYMPKPVNNTYWNKSQWEPGAPADDHMWPGPPIEPVPSVIGGKETYDYGHMHDNPPLAMQSIDYNHMSEFSYNQVYPPESHYDQYWSQVNAAPPITPMFLKKERSSAPSASHPVEEDTSQIDAAKRKQLPAWIREGLEKMEQERIKKIEKERSEKEKAEKLAQAKMKSQLDLKDSAVTAMPVKSKFDSDSEGEEEEEEEEVEVVNSTILKRQEHAVAKRSPSPEDFRSEEEKRQEFLLNVRRLLTEVLLTVTDAEMYAVAEEVIKKEKLKARQLASSASLSSVMSGLRGLANYGTESEASEAEDDHDASDSEEELYRRIQEKKRQFAIKGKKIMAEIERKEIEKQNEALKAKNDTSKSINNEIVEPEKNNKESEKPALQEKAELIPFLPPVEVAEPAVDEVSLINHENVHSPQDDKENNDNEQKLPDKKESDSSDSSSSSSESENESGRKSKKKTSKNEFEKKVLDIPKRSKDRSPSRKHRRHSQSSDSDSSSRHRKSRSHDKSSKKSSSYKKKKKYKRSDSSSSCSNSSVKKRRYSSKSEQSHNHHRDRRSHSYDRDRKRRRSVSPKDYRSSRDSHRSRDSYSHRHEKDKYDKRDKYDKYYEHRRSPSPHRGSSKLPKKYQSSRSPSSESESSGKKSKRYRNH